MVTGLRQPGPFLRGLAILGNIGGFIFPLGAIALLSVPGVLAYQAVQWMEHGRWPPLSFADGLGWVGLSMPRFDTPAFQQASDNLLGSPLSLVLLFGIGVPLLAYAQFSKWLERRVELEKVPFE